MYISLDTNVFISVSKKEFDCVECEKIINDISEKGWKCGISVIVLAELLVGAYKDKKFFEAELIERKFGELYEIQLLIMGIIHLGAKYRAELNLKLPDALIVGSAIFNKADYLISRDIEIKQQLPIKIVTPIDFVKHYI